MTHHDTNVDRDRVEILHEADDWSVFETSDPAKAVLVFDLFTGRRGIDWVCWKQPGQTRYRAMATYGREPDCPNCCAGGCPAAPHDVDCSCAGNGVCDYWNKAPVGARAE